MCPYYRYRHTLEGDAADYIRWRKDKEKTARLPYYTIPYHTMPYHTMPRIISYHTIPYRTIPYRTMICHTIPYHTIPYHTIPYHTIPYHTISYHTITTISYHTPCPMPYLQLQMLTIPPPVSNMAPSGFEMRVAFLSDPSPKGAAGQVPTTIGLACSIHKCTCFFFHLSSFGLGVPADTRLESSTHTC